MKRYNISKGRHRSGIYFRPVFGKSLLCYQVIFGDDCVYDLGNANQHDINKLFGISSGLHHKNSARFGWACVGDRIELFAYCYINGKRVSESVGIADVNKTYELYIDITDEQYKFRVYSPDQPFKTVTIKREKACRMGYLLYPYFGGDETAPHDMHILMRRTIMH